MKSCRFETSLIDLQSRVAKLEEGQEEAFRNNADRKRENLANSFMLYGHNLVKADLLQHGKRMEVNKKIAKNPKTYNEGKIKL